MKKNALFLLLAACMCFSGCSKDAEISAFLTEWESVTNEIAGKIEIGEVDAARAAFDARKEALESKWNDVKAARSFQVSKETQKRFEETRRKTNSVLMSAVARGSMKMATRRAEVNKMEALMKEFGETFKV